MILDCDYHDLEAEHISRSAFDGLPEYSCSVPTGVYPGKVWRCNLNAFAPRIGTEPLWVIREYVADGPDHCSIDCRRPIITEAPPAAYGTLAKTEARP